MEPDAPRLPELDAERPPTASFARRLDAGWATLARPERVTVGVVMVLIFLGTIGFLSSLSSIGRQSAALEAERTAYLATEAARREAEAVEDSVALGRVLVGMTADQVRRAWGEPRDTDRTTHTGGVMERWYYSSRAVSLEDGRVTFVHE